jgi:hypothetical protein
MISVIAVEAEEILHNAVEIVVGALATTPTESRGCVLTTTKIINACCVEQALLTSSSHMVLSRIDIIALDSSNDFLNGLEGLRKRNPHLVVVAGLSTLFESSGEHSYQLELCFAILSRLEIRVHAVDSATDEGWESFTRYLSMIQQ